MRKVLLSEDSEHSVVVGGGGAINSISVDESATIDIEDEQAFHLEFAVAVAHHVDLGVGVVVGGGGGGARRTLLDGRQKLNDQLQRILCVSGFSMSYPVVIVLIASWMVFNTLWYFASFTQNSYCIILALCVAMFQIESLVLYAYGFFCVTPEFMKCFVDALWISRRHALNYRDDVNDNENENENENGNENENRSAHKDINTHINMDNQSKNYCHLRRPMPMADIDHNLIGNHCAINSGIHYANENMNMDGNKEEAPTMYGCASPIQLFVDQLLKASFFMFFSYASGYLIFAEDEFTDPRTRHKHFTRFLYVIISNVVDIIRYLPQVMHVALVTTFYQTFRIQLQRLRLEWRIPERQRTFIDAEQAQLRLTVTCREMQLKMEKIIRPYYRLTRNGRIAAWIGTYMILNVITVVLFWASVLANNCDYVEKQIYYYHYSVELFAFLGCFIWLLWPFYVNHRALHNFVEDVLRVPHANAEEYAAMMRYLNGLVAHSPVSINGYRVTFVGLLKMVVFVVGTIVFDLVARVADFTFWQCEQRK